jgi:hypothetical protein
MGSIYLTLIYETKALVTISRILLLPSMYFLIEAYYYF